MIEQGLRAIVSLSAAVLTVRSQTGEVWCIRLMLGPQKIED